MILNDGILGFIFSYLRTGAVAMTTEMENKKHALALLALGVNATLEETKMAYDEWASDWEEVNM